MFVPYHPPARMDKRPARSIACAALVMLLCPVARAAVFDVNYLGGPPIQAMEAIDRSAEIWAGVLQSDVAIKVNVVWFPLGGATLGITFPNGRRDFESAPEPSTWYATALANSIAGLELNPGEADMDVYLNSGVDWYMGTDGATPAGMHDLVTVALHEIAHGLGFVGLAKKEGSIGSFGLLEPADFFSLPTSFPWPVLDTLPGIFDRFLRNNTPQFLVEMGNPSAQLGSQFTSNQLYWEGAHALESSGGAPVRIHAPATFALGSSCVHLHQGTYPTGSPNALMTPFNTPGVANHWPGPIALGMLRDIGWLLMPGVGITEVVHEPHLPWFHPVPTRDRLFLDPLGAGSGQMRVVDAMGRELMSTIASDVLDVSGLAQGTYVLERSHLERVQRGRFIVE